MTQREQLTWRPPVRDYADLEVRLHRLAADTYTVEMSISRSDSEAGLPPLLESPALMRLHIGRLRRKALDPEAYGRSLTKSLFGDPAVHKAFADACRYAEGIDMPLRLRIFIARSALELHTCAWETLRDPRDGSWLLTNERVLFSRYLSSHDWRPVRPRPKSDLRALVVIANPVNLSSYAPHGRPLGPIDVAGELERARYGLGNIHQADLASSGSATLNNIISHVRSGYNVLYLVAHGALFNGQPWLWLEDEAGAVDRISGIELVTRLRELEQRPRLVVLVSCQSAGWVEGAGSDDSGALTALGPLLAGAGVPAVLAMQGNVTMKTVTEFMPVFFEELQRDGQVDRSVAAARGAVRHRPDSWMPVLFMRLKTGRLWYVPGFGDDGQTFERWPALLNDIRRWRCTPILGPGLIEPLCGSTSEIADRWAEEYHFPLAAHNRESLPQVAQDLAIHQQPTFPHEKLADYLCGQILSRYGRDLPIERREDLERRLLDPSLGPREQYRVLDELIECAGGVLRKRDEIEPHMVLAQLPFRIYITANPDSLLETALIAVGKEPVVQVCRWNDEMAQAALGDDADFEPEIRRPLVYHLFGTFEDAESLVLTEDDYFNFLTGMAKNKDQIPSAVLADLSRTGLLFLGFHVEEWDFRVLLHSILDQQEGKTKGEQYTRVAAQIDPTEDRVLAPPRARRYLMEYFEHDKISIYWGSVKDFTTELDRRWHLR
jgi:hypothetical protein